MKGTVAIFLVFCIIGVCGCNKPTQVYAPITVTTSSEDTKVTPSGTQNSGGQEINPNVKTETNISSSASATDTTSSGGTIEPTRLTIANWYPYHEVTRTRGGASNEVIINSSGWISNGAGIVSPNLGTTLRGRTLMLYFSNTEKSDFTEDRMVKVQCDDRVVEPTGIITILGFILVEDAPPGKGIEYEIPNTFNGKIDFVFDQAKLNDFKITAYYE